MAHGSSRLALAVVLWVAAAWLFEDPQSRWASVVAFPAIALVYGLLVSAALDPSSMLARSSSRVTEWLATLSYALYLTHEASVHVTQSALADVGFARIRWVIHEATS
jgi:peptidoglycan/LPS O-acetylase OafA/YrhL